MWLALVIGLLAVVGGAFLLAAWLGLSGDVEDRSNDL
jgi:hypothetical protein